MNKDRLQAKIEAIFESQPELDEIIVCEDGSCFYLKDKNKALNHCNFTAYGKREKPLEHSTITRKEIALPDESEIIPGEEVTPPDSEQKQVENAEATEEKKNAKKSK